jgi:RHS repeat-associated protein
MRSLAWIAVAAALALTPTPAWAIGEPAPGAASAKTLRLPDGPGSVRGLADSPTVNLFAGELEHAIPLDLPGGPAGFKPHLEIAYSGGLGNGPIGVGWTLPGMAIRRSERLGVPHYDATDELELLGIPGGGKLIPAGDGTWRIEGQGQAIKIEPSGDGFLVWSSDGTRYTLGTSAAGRQQSGSKVAAWFVEQVRSNADQVIDFSYESDGGQVYLSEVRWGGTGVHAVHFDYGARLDEVVSYRSGFRVATRRRLDTIEISSFGQRLRAYALGYDTTLPLSRLQQVVVTGTDGVTALPTLTIGYAPVQTTDTVKVTGTGTWILNSAGVSIADVDGDGLDDLVRLAPEIHEFRRNLGGRYATTPRTITGGPAAGLDKVQLMDLDGDSRPELVVVESNSWRAYRLENRNWVSIGTWGGTANLPLRGTGLELADLDGDGRTDSIKANSDGLILRMSGDGTLLPEVQRPPISAGNPAVRPGESNVRFGDVNGDGLADVAWLMPDQMTIYLGRGDGTFEEYRTVGYPWGHLAVDLAQVRFPDLNRDGIADCVWFSDGYVRWYRGKATNEFETAPVVFVPPEGPLHDIVVGLADVDGNGSQDVVWSSPRGMWMLDIAGPTTAGMLTSISNGLGKSTSVAYGASSLMALDDEINGVPWAVKLPISIPVPVRTDVTVGSLEPTRTMRYRVRDGIWDGKERRFLGFLQSTAITVGPTAGTTLQEETTYHRGEGADRVLRGRPLKVRRLRGDGTLLEVTENDWSAFQLPGLPSTPGLRLPVPTAERTKVYEGSSTPVTTSVLYELDAEGRVAVERKLGRTDDGDEIIVHRIWASDAATWVRDKLCEETVTNGDGTVVSSLRNFYGDTGPALPFQSIGKGWLRESWAWLFDPTSGAPGRWVLRQRTGYAGDGNAITIFEHGVTRHVTYDARGLHPLDETIVPATGSELRWSLTWDATLGLASSLTGPDGVTIHAGYDPLGRPISMAIDGHPAHVQYVYDWTPGAPRNYTYEWDGPLAEIVPWSGTWSATGRWRQRVEETDGAGETRYHGVRLAADHWLINGWQQRDGRGLVAFVADGFDHPAASLPVAPPPGITGESIAHDALGRTTSEILATGKGRSYAYGPMTRTIAADGIGPVTSTYDGQGRIAITSRTVGGVLETTTASYDAADRVLGFSLQAGAAVHSYVYDTLGRLVKASDPDLGERRLHYDDDDRMTSKSNALGQSVSYQYDAIGRLTRKSASTGESYIYHYDQPRAGSPATRTMGRLAWVEEPTGIAESGYDERGTQTYFRREVSGVSVVEHQRIAASGLLLGVDFDDGFAYDVSHDPAGRAIAIGDLWQATEIDPRGAVRGERYGNGVTQTNELDVLGLRKRVTIRRPNGAAFYDVEATRTPYNALATLIDHDTVGLDHAATFSYDEASRLTGATLGPSGSQGYQFSYAYDGLQNMVARTATGPRPLDVEAGQLRYGEAGAGPRQLSSVLRPDGTIVTHDYDDAGRQVAADGQTFEYNALDQLIAVHLSDGRVVRHRYTFDGQRVSTTGADGIQTVWLTPELSQRGNVREHHVSSGSAVIARVVRQMTSSPDRGGAGAASLFTGLLRSSAILAVLALLLGLVAMATRRRVQVGRVALASLAAAIALQMDCAPSFEAAETTQASYVTQQRIFYHQGFAPGPAAATAEDGSVFDERRYEPFGAAIDEYRDGASVGGVDYVRDPYNSLNKLTDADTALSYHGARWMASDSGRWLTPDPPVQAPDRSFIERPWDLHPYQYVRQNPVTYWDPDGNAPGALPPPRPWTKAPKQPFNFYIGNNAHYEIALDYAGYHWDENLFLNVMPISTIVQELGLTPEDGIDVDQLTEMPDIFNASTGEVYEIKSYRQEALANEEAMMYVAKLRSAGFANAHLGSSLAPGVSGYLPAPAGYFRFWSPRPGSIVYEYTQYRVPRGVPVVVPEPKTVPEDDPEDEPEEWEAPELVPTMKPEHVAATGMAAMAAYAAWLLILL